MPPSFGDGARFERRLLDGECKAVDRLLADGLVEALLDIPLQQRGEVFRRGKTFFHHRPFMKAASIGARWQNAAVQAIATHIDRLNLGPVPTIQLNWRQPHEGNLIDFLFRARAFQSTEI